MPDYFASHADSPSAPSRNASAAVPHDTNELPFVGKFLYVGTAGNVVLRSIDGAADVTYKNVPAGSYLTVRAKFIRATGTTAADIVIEA